MTVTSSSNTHIISLNHLWHINPYAIDWAVILELEKINNPHQCDLIVSLFGEPDPPCVFLAINILKDFECKSITIVTDINFKDKLTAAFDNTKINFVFIHIWAVVASNYTPNPNLIWNNNNPYSLLLTGRLLSQNRLGLLKELYDQQLLDSILWSFPVDQKDLPQINSIVSKECFTYLSNNAISLHSHIPDETDDRFDGSRLFNFTNLYSKTNFSIISETVFDSYDIGFLSEKTYRAIINKHPFLLVGAPYALEHLDSLGFRTFEEYFPHKYDFVEDHDHRFKLIIDNISHIQSVIAKNTINIQRDIEYNFNHLMNIVSTQINIVKKLVGDLNDMFESVQSKSEYINQLCIDRRAELDQRIINCKLLAWLNFYNDIKANSWPELTSESDFYSLPQSIQDECINTFHFGPGIYREPERYILFDKK